MDTAERIRQQSFHPHPNREADLIGYDNFCPDSHR
jgi:hypothetical protein